MGAYFWVFSQEPSPHRTCRPRKIFQGRRAPRLFSLWVAHDCVLKRTQTTFRALHVGGGCRRKVRFCSENPYTLNPKPYPLLLKVEAMSEKHPKAQVILQLTSVQLCRTFTLNPKHWV